VSDVKADQPAALLGLVEVEVPWPLGVELPEWRFVVGFGRHSLAPLSVTVERWVPPDIEKGGAGITALALRRIPFGAVFAEARRRIPAELTRQIVRLEEQLVLTVPEWEAVLQRAMELSREAALQSHHRGGQRPIPLEELATAARAYGEALIAGEKPTRKVMKALGVPQSVATKRIYQARQAGFIGPTRKGRAGGVAQTVILDAAVRTRTALPLKAKVGP
jgi:hypothetical protein